MLNGGGLAAFKTSLNHAVLVILTTLVAVCVADMNFHSGDPIAESIKASSTVPLIWLASISRPSMLPSVLISICIFTSEICAFSKRQDCVWHQLREPAGIYLFSAFGYPNGFKGFISEYRGCTPVASRPPIKSVAGQCSEYLWRYPVVCSHERMANYSGTSVVRLSFSSVPVTVSKGPILARTVVQRTRQECAQEPDIVEALRNWRGRLRNPPFIQLSALKKSTRNSTDIWVIELCPSLE